MSNQTKTPETRKALQNMKQETAQEVGFNLKQGCGNADGCARDGHEGYEAWNQAQQGRSPSAQEREKR